MLTNIIKRIPIRRSFGKSDSLVKRSSPNSSLNSSFNSSFITPKIHLNICFNQQRIVSNRFSASLYAQGSSQSLPRYLAPNSSRLYCKSQEPLEDDISVEIPPDVDPNQKLSHKAAVDLLEANGLIKNETAHEIFREIDPAHFSQPNQEEFIPEDQEEENLFADNWLHSALVIVAIISVLVGDLPAKAKILDVGCGGGYMTAILASLVGPKGTVLAIDKDASRIEHARESIQTHYPHLTSRIEFKVADVFDFHPNGSFNVVHVGGALAEVPPSWSRFLKPSGCIFAATPEIEPELQETAFMLKKHDLQKDGTFKVIPMMFVNYEELQETGNKM